jgi:5-oxoprolinase (ATP-hydrolysing) subunit A
MTRFIDLSCDLGEAVSAEEIATEEQLWPLISSANVACGGHIGDGESMHRAVELAARHRVTLGAHPSYPDRENFGRKSMNIPVDDLRASLVAQLRELEAIAQSRGVALHRVKPHGALYNDAHANRALAGLVIDVVRDFPNAAIVCSAVSEMANSARERGVPVVREAFADRRYLPDNSLMPRSGGGSLLLEFGEAAEQALSLAERGVARGADGREIVIAFDTICVHGDMPNAVERVRRIREVLEAHGFTTARTGALER